MNRSTVAALVVWAGVVLFQASPATQAGAVIPGSPLAGIRPHEFSEFRMGLDDFLEVETADEGLGPAYNGTSCAVCHNIPAVGGGGVIVEVRAGYRDATREGHIGLNAAGDTLIHLLSVPSHGCQVRMPDDVDVIARRIPIPLFGAGLVEAIADETIVAREDPFDRDRDGISGRAGVVVDLASGNRRVGRFGWKSQHATLLAFGADAYRNEMGITNDLFPQESAFGVTGDRMRVCDSHPDPEDRMDPATRRRGIDNFESFMRFLSPVSRGAITDTVRQGERVFAAVGCANCHVPSMTTAANPNPLFDRKVVPLFSDLLLHDVGTGDGIAQAAAEPAEIRTPALWGLRFRRPLLHDGSAVTIAEAIERHRNEAELARRGFAGLQPDERSALLAFLRSL
jgi:CxxC motif-containing protein (DUF1111 family)